MICTQQVRKHADLIYNITPFYTHSFIHVYTNPNFCLSVELGIRLFPVVALSIAQSYTPGVPSSASVGMQSILTMKPFICIYVGRLYRFYTIFLDQIGLTTSHCNNINNDNKFAYLYSEVGVFLTLGKNAGLAQPWPRMASGEVIFLSSHPQFFLSFSECRAYVSRPIVLLSCYLFLPGILHGTVVSCQKTLINVFF